MGMLYSRCHVPIAFCDVFMEVCLLVLPGRSFARKLEGRSEMIW